MLTDEFVPRPAQGRVVSADRHVGLGDVRPDATVRLDALARFVQDVADDDAASAAFDGGGVWVLRRLTMRIDRVPRFRADVRLHTWCSGVGARWAERRTDLEVDGAQRVQAIGLWVYVDPDRGAPMPLPPAFDTLWGISAGGRKVRPTLSHPAPGADTRAEPWVLRATDFDVLGHVNNAAYWAPVEEELARRGRPRVRWAAIEFGAGLDATGLVECLVADTGDGFACWLRTGGDVRASALVGCGTGRQEQS